MLRVIALGNDLRGDDAAGLQVARRLRDAAVPGLDVRCPGGDPGAILDACDGAEDVMVVDATRSGCAPGAIHRLPPDRVVAARRGAGTHDAGLAEALALAGALGRAMPRRRVCLIEGCDFTLGTPPTPAVTAAVEQVAAELVALAASGRHSFEAGSPRTGHAT